MKVAIFGSSGRTGILTVYQALDKGYFVTAFSRKATRVTIRHPKITVIEGDIMDYDRVKQAISGNEAVIIALGTGVNKPTRVLSDGTANIIRAMKECGVPRVICMSSAGILGTDTSRLFRWIYIPLLLRHIFRDKIRQMDLIRESGLEWVIVRPPRLTLAPKTGTYQITSGRPATTSVPRADVADFMLKLLTLKTYDRQLPAISGF
jgi:putative NADH-flavin reductase